MDQQHSSFSPASMASQAFQSFPSESLSSNDSQQINPFQNQHQSQIPLSFSSQQAHPSLNTQNTAQNISSPSVSATPASPLISNNSQNSPYIRQQPSQNQSFPINIRSKEDVQKCALRIRQLQSELGDDAINNSEFISLMKIINELKIRSRMAQQSQQQMLQQQQLNQPSAQSPVIPNIPSQNSNAASPGFQSIHQSHPSPQQMQNFQTDLASSNFKQNNISQSQASSPPAVSSSSSLQLFTQDQLNLLGAQSFAFKTLCRTKQIPPQLLQQLFNPTVSSAFSSSPASLNPPTPNNNQHHHSNHQSISHISSAGLPIPQQMHQKIPSIRSDSPGIHRASSRTNSPKNIPRQSNIPSSPIQNISATPVKSIQNQRSTSISHSPHFPNGRGSNAPTPQNSAPSPTIIKQNLPSTSLPQSFQPGQDPSPSITPRSRQGSKSQLSGSKHGPSLPLSLSSSTASPNPNIDSQPQPTVPRPLAKTNLEKLGVDGMVDPKTFYPDTVDVSNIVPISTKVPYISSLLPVGVDLEQIKMEREKDINTNIFNRLVDLSMSIEGFDLQNRLKNETEIPPKITETNNSSDIKTEPENDSVSETDNSTVFKTNSGVTLKLETKISSGVFIKSESIESQHPVLTNHYSGLSEKQIDDLIEFKALKLLNYQKALRGDITTDLTYFNSVSMNEQNQIHFTRMKQQTLHEANITEQFDLNQRAEITLRKTEIKRNHLTKICDHAREVQSIAKTHANKRNRLGRAIMSFHTYTEKEEQKRAEKTARQRLQALKANDEEAYIKLLDQTKDTRITHLLRQTNSFLDSLAQAVKNQQNETMSISTEEPPAIETENDSTTDADMTEEVDKEKVDYYAVAHRIKEDVTKQPSILVGGTLKEYQLKGLQWMISLYNNNLNGILADEMGLGKTIQTISLITYLIETKKVPGPYLVIVPLSTLTNWTMEFERWAPSVKKVVYKGPPVARKLLQGVVRSGDFQVLLTTFEYVIKDKPILSRIKWVHMIMDEGHRMKNTQSKLSYTLTTYYTSKFRLILTGTPLQNNLPELWALLNFVLPKIFNSVKSFDEWFNTPFANTGSQDKMDLSEEETLLIIRRLHKVLRPFLLRRLKKDVEKDLPDKVEKVIKCKMSALQSSLYQQVLRFKKMFVGENSSGSAGAKGLNNKLMQLKKVCNHPFVFEQVESVINPTKRNDALLWRSGGKFELLDRVLPKFKAMNHRVLIFFQMTQIMDIMEDFMLLLGYKYLRLDGGTKADERSELLAKFNAPDSPYFAFLLSTRAGGLGLNLQTADTVIIFDTDWNPHQDLQAQDRAHRIGQTKEVRILRLITENSVEETILDRAHRKLDIDGKVIQAGKFDNKSTSEEQEAFLRRLLEQEELKRLQKSDNDEELDDDDLNEILARNDEEREIYRKIDEERNAVCPYGKGRKLDRLLSDAELPEMYQEAYLKKEAARQAMQPTTTDQSLYGRGARERKEIHYDDGLTEEQWVEAIDADDDTPEEAVARKRARIEKRRQNKMRREQQRVSGSGSSPRGASASPFDTPSPVDFMDSLSQGGYGSSSGTAANGLKRRRGRRPRIETDLPSTGGTVTTEDALFGDITAPIPPRRKGKGRPPKIKETLTAEARRDLTATMRALYDHVCSLKDESGRNLNFLFLELPSKRIYMTYYTIIQNPIALDVINKRINNNTYQRLGEFRADFKLMFDNARRYNEEGSQVYQDANIMERELNEKLEELVPGILASTRHQHSGNANPSNGSSSLQTAAHSGPSYPNGMINDKTENAAFQIPNDASLETSQAAAASMEYGADKIDVNGLHTTAGTQDIYDDDDDDDELGMNSRRKRLKMF